MNLLESYNRVESQAIATQLAILEVVTYPNVMGTGLKQTRDKSVKVANWLWRQFSNPKLLEVTPAMNLTDQVLGRAQCYFQVPQDELISKVFAELGCRLECPPSDLEKLSALLICEAAAGLDVSGDLLLGQQAEQVAQKYQESCLKQIREQLSKQSPEDARRVEDSISQRLAEMTPAEKLELQKTLDIAELSGKSVRAAFLQTGGPLAGIAAVNMAGFGAYIALSVVLHAIFTTMLGITLPFAMYTGASSMLAMLTGPVGIGLAIAAGLVGYSFGHKKLNRSQYAMVVWACVARYGRRLYTPNELLPSARTWNLLPAGTDSGLSVARTTATNSTALVWPRPGACELEAVRSQADESDQELSTRDSERKVATLTNLAATEDVRSTAKELARLKSKLASAETELTATRQRAADTTTALNQRNTAIACLEAEISRLSLEGTASAERVRNAESRAQATQDRLRAAEEKYELKLEGRRSEIEKLWAVHFPRFSFGSKALRWVADKTFRERLEVERALIELRDASDPASISRGKMNGSDQHHSAFSLAPDTPARIYYRIKGGKVQITQILKKNEQKQFDASA